MNRVVHAENPGRAIMFFRALFGCTAYMKDTEGNVFGLYQIDPRAK